MSDYQNTQPQELHHKWQDTPGGVDVIDVRTPVEYKSAHAPMAKLMPLDQLDPQAVATMRNGSDRPLYVICKSGSRAAKACEKLTANGHTNVHCIAGGTDAWIAAGLPVERGETKVISLERQVRIAAGSLVVIGGVLGLTVSPWFLAISLFVGCGLVFAGVTDWCGMGLVLARMPWNKA